MIELIKPLGVKKTQDLPLYFLIGEPIDISQRKISSGIYQRSDSFDKLADATKILKPSLVIFDSLTRFHSSKENDSSEMSLVFNNVQWFKKETGAAVLFTHHFRKGEFGKKGDRIRGSSDIRAFPDYTILIEESQGNILVTHDKSRWSEPIPPFSVTFDHSEDNGCSLVYNGEKSQTSPYKVWDFVKEQLYAGDKYRKELIQLADESSICQWRKLQDELKWRTENGFIKQIRDGKQVFYQLSDKVREEMEIRDGVDELTMMFENKEDEDG